jgi:hypothetical protein
MGETALSLATTRFAVVVIPVHCIQAIKPEPLAQNQIPERNIISPLPQNELVRIMRSKEAFGSGGKTPRFQAMHLNMIFSCVLENNSRK